MLQESSISSIQDTGFHENVVSLIWNLLVRKTRPVGILGGAVPVTQSQVSVFHHSWGQIPIYRGYNHAYLQHFIAIKVTSTAPPSSQEKQQKCAETAWSNCRSASPPGPVVVEITTGVNPIHYVQIYDRSGICQI